MVEELPTPLPEGSFPATLLLPKLVPQGTSLTPLANTIDGDGYGGSSVVPIGVGCRVGETIGEDDVKADYFGSSLA